MVSDNSYVPLPQLRLSLRTLLPGGPWGLGWTGRFRTVDPEKQGGFSLRLSDTCPFKGFKLKFRFSAPGATESHQLHGDSGQLKTTQGGLAFGMPACPAGRRALLSQKSVLETQILLPRRLGLSKQGDQPAPHYPDNDNSSTPPNQVDKHTD